MSMWRARWDVEWRDYVLSIWRSDFGCWGFGSVHYDGGIWRWIGLGKLAHLSWGPR